MTPTAPTVYRRTMRTTATAAAAASAWGGAALLLCLANISAAAAAVTASAAALPRRVRVDGQRFVVADTNRTIVLSGPNVVVKGPPYLPSVSGTTVCHDVIDGSCTRYGNCSSCTTFNQADIDHIKANGWNSIRLGVVWAGAQPRDEDQLDEGFLRRLHAILALTDAAGIAVVLDNHADAVGSANCGNGIPMWFSQKAAPHLIGKPLVSAFPYSVVPGVNVKSAKGYSHCGNDAAKWAMHAGATPSDEAASHSFLQICARFDAHRLTCGGGAGDPNYNLLNECCQVRSGWLGIDSPRFQFARECRRVWHPPRLNNRVIQAINDGNPPSNGFSTVAQAAMDAVITEGGGREDFVRYWRLLAEAVAQHPSAFAAELMNEPLTIKRDRAYATVSGRRLCPHVFGAAALAGMCLARCCVFWP